MRDRKPGRPNRRPESPAITPLDAEKRRLQEEVTRLHAEMERKKRLIEEAPQRKAAADKRRREELVNARSRTDARSGSRVALLDPRHGLEADVGAATRGPGLRKHRRQGMWTFFALCGVLGIVLYWIYTTVIRGLAQ